MKPSTTKVFSLPSFLSGLFHPLILKRLSWRSSSASEARSKFIILIYGFWVERFLFCPFFQNSPIVHKTTSFPFFAEIFSGLFFQLFNLTHSVWKLLKMSQFCSMVFSINFCLSDNTVWPKISEIFHFGIVHQFLALCHWPISGNTVEPKSLKMSYLNFGIFHEFFGLL